MDIHKAWKQEWVWLTFLVIVSLTSQFVFIRPVTLSDEMIYYRAAVDFPRLPEIPNHWTMRLGLILPLAVLYRIFGHCEITYYLLPFLSTIVLVLSTYGIGRLFFNRLVGISAALWMSFLPYFLLETGNLLPDILSSALTTTAIFLTLSARETAGEKQTEWRILLAGILFGWAYMAKEYIALFALIIPLIFFVYKIPFKHLGVFAAGVLMPVSIEFLIHILAYGNPLVRLTTTTPRATTGFIQRDASKIAGYFFILIKKYRGLGNVIMSAIGIGYAALTGIRRSKKHLVLMGWMLMIYGIYTFLGLLPIILDWQNEVILRLQIFRYWIPFLPPLAICCAAGIQTFMDKLVSILFKKKTWGRKLANGLFILILTALSANGMTAVSRNFRFIHTDSAHYQELRDFLAQLPPDGSEIWIVRDMKIGYEYALPIYARTPLGKEIWSGSLKYLNTEGEFLQAEEIKAGFVLIDRFHFNPNAYPIPNYLANPPQNWTMVFESSNERIALYTVN